MKTIISEKTDNFVSCYLKLPKQIRKKTRDSYKLWLNDINYKGTDFKKIKNNFYRVKIGYSYRAICFLSDNNIYKWFWIGTHEEYNNIIKRL